MTEQETLTVIAAIAGTDHSYIGIRPADATPAEAPCIVLGANNGHGLAYALDAAQARWPQCQQWALIGSDQVLHLLDPTWPPGMRELRTPEQLATFST